MTAGDAARDGETVRQLLIRWSLASLFVLLTHGGVAFAIASWPKPETPAGEPPAAVMIELAPLPVAPEATPQEVAVGIEQQVSDDSTPTETEEEPVEEETPPEPEVEPTKTEPPPEPPLEPVEREVETETPELPKIETADAVLEAPAPPPPEPEVVEKTPEEPKKKPERKKPKPRPKSAAQAASAPKPVQTRRARTNAAPTSGVGASTSIATWRGSVMAHLNRHKRYPGGGGGTSSVAFTIDRSGRVLSARLIRSSGNATLDREAVALARRASPVPRPPPNMGRGTIVLTVPVRFSR